MLWSCNSTMPESNGGCGNPRNWRGVWLLFTGQKHWGKRMMQVHHPMISSQRETEATVQSLLGGFPGHSVHLHLVKGWLKTPGPDKGEMTRTLLLRDEGLVLLPASNLDRWKYWLRERNPGQVAEGRDAGCGLWPWTSHSREEYGFSNSATFSLWRAPRSTLNQ